MHELVELYVIDEKKFSSKLERLSDREKYGMLVTAVKANGKLWQTIEVRISEFADALEIIDKRFGDTGFLPVFAFNNSPFDLLGPDSDCPDFGYFSPSQVEDLHACFQDLSEQDVQDLLSIGDKTIENVFYAFRSAAEEAARLGFALAVLF